MSYTIEGRPDEFTPVFNPIYYYPYSTNYTLDGFNYLLDVYNTNTSEFLARFSIPPRPVDGYGVGDIQQLLASQVGTFFDQNQNSFSAGTDNYILYNIEFGEEYIYEWAFDDNTNSLGPNIAFYTSGTTAPVFQAGDLVNVIQDSGYTYSIYNGIHTVLTAYTSYLGYTVIIDVPLQTSGTPVNPGVIKYANNAKIQTTGITNSSGIAFNGAIAHEEFPTYTSTLFNVDNASTTHRFLTNVPSGYHVRTENNMWINYYTQNTTNDNQSLIVTTDYGQYEFPNPLAPLTSTYIHSVPCGPYDLTNFSPSGTALTGDFPIFKNTSWAFYNNGFGGSGYTSFIGTTTPPYSIGDIVTIKQIAGATNPQYNGNHTVVDVDATANTITIDVLFGVPTNPEGGSADQIVSSYSIHIDKVAGLTYTQISEDLTFNIDDSCSRWENIEIYFIDRLGSYIPMNFQLASAKKISINKSEYQQILGNLGTTPSGPGWTYQSTDRGRTQINTKITQELKMTSNWITQDESEFLQELYSSPIVYIKENGKLWPVIVTERDYDIVTKNNKKNIQLKMTVQYANNSRVQNFT